MMTHKPCAVQLFVADASFAAVAVVAVPVVVLSSVDVLSEVVVGVSIDALDGGSADAVLGVVLTDVNVNILEALSRVTSAPIKRLPVGVLSC